MNANQGIVIGFFFMALAGGKGIGAKSKIYQPVVTNSFF